MIRAQQIKYVKKNLSTCLRSSYNYELAVEYLGKLMPKFKQLLNIFTHRFTSLYKTGGKIATPYYWYKKIAMTIPSITISR